MHRVKHGPMDPSFFLPFFGPVGEGKAPWGRGFPVSPVSFVSLMFPVSLVSPVSCVPCIPCVPCVPCVPLCSVCPLSCVSRFPVSPVSLLPFQKNEMFGGVALVSCGMWRENSHGFLCFHMTTCWVFFARAGGQRMWFFMKIESKNTKFCLTCLKDNLFNF